MKVRLMKIFKDILPLGFGHHVIFRERERESYDALFLRYLWSCLKIPLGRVHPL